MTKRNIIAAGIHMHMVDHAAHGYTQGPGRWGGADTEQIKVEGERFAIGKGDYDCSSSAITAWRLALTGTLYAGKLAAATYTGNMRAVFTASGLFTAVPFTTANLSKAKPGDVLLNDSNHTGIYQGAGKVSEFLVNEKGTITGGKVGDQTGNEAKVRNVSAYGKGWQWILMYNGKADPKEERVPDKYRMLKGTNIRTGRSIARYRKVGYAAKGDLILVSETKKDKLGKVWGKVGRYRWLVLSTKLGKRAIKL